QIHRSILSARPYEAAPLEPLREQAHAVTVPPQVLDPIAAPAAEHEQLTGERILVQLQLHQRCKTVEALTHVGHAARDPDLRPRRQPDHRHCASACSTAESCDVETSPATRTRTLTGNSISIVPE